MGDAVQFIVGKPQVTDVLIVGEVEDMDDWPTVYVREARAYSRWYGLTKQGRGRLHAVDADQLVLCTTHARNAKLGVRKWRRRQEEQDGGR